MEKNRMIDIVRNCLALVYEQDKDLLDIDIHEDAVNNRFSRYLAEHLESKKIKVDAEYNRHIAGLKKYGIHGKSAIVDVVVHQRGTDEENIVAFECKKGGIKRTLIKSMR